MSARWATLPPGYQLKDGRSHAERKPAPPPPSAHHAAARSHPRRQTKRLTAPLDFNKHGHPIVSEYEHQVALIEWVGEHADVFPGIEWLAASANGGWRRPGVAGQLKASGVSSGFPDLQLTLARGGYHGLFIELKTPVGSLSTDQRAWLAHLNAEGYLALAAYGWRQARDELTAYWRANQSSDTQRAAS